MIEFVLFGGYEPVVHLDNGKYQNLGVHLKELDAAISTPGAVMASLLLQGLYHPLLSSVNSPASEGWFYDSSPAGGLKLLYVPTLEELGYDPAQYKLQAKAAAVCFDQNATADNVSVRVIDISKDSTVPGSATTGSLNGLNAQQKIETEFFDITPGLAYLVDARKLDVNSNLAAAFSRQELLIRVVRK